MTNYNLFGENSDKTRIDENLAMMVKEYQSGFREIKKAIMHKSEIGNPNSHDNLIAGTPIVKATHLELIDKKITAHLAGYTPAFRLITELNNKLEENLAEFKKECVNGVFKDKKGAYDSIQKIAEEFGNSFDETFGTDYKKAFTS